MMGLAIHQYNSKPHHWCGIQLYGTTPRLKLIALNAATGAQKWVFNPAGNTNSSPSNFGMNNNRGVTYWESGDNKRILYCAGSNVYAVNALNGQLIKNLWPRRKDRPA